MAVKKNTISGIFGSIVVVALTTMPAQEAQSAPKKKTTKKATLVLTPEGRFKERCRGLLPEASEIAIDGDTGEILVNRDRNGQVASLNKLPLLDFLYKAMQKGELITPETPVRVTPAIRAAQNMTWRATDKGPWSPSQARDWVAMDALKVTGAKSFNDTALALVQGYETALGTRGGIEDLRRKFAERVTESYKKFGPYVMTDPTGLPDDKSETTLLTIAKIIKDIAENNPALAQILAEPEMTIKGKKIKSTNPLFDVLDSKYRVVIGKTGYICKTGYMLGAMVTTQDSGSVIAVTRGAISHQARVQQYLDLLREAYSIKAGRAVDVQKPQDQQTQQEELENNRQTLDY